MAPDYLKAMLCAVEASGSLIRSITAAICHPTRRPHTARYGVTILLAGYQM